MKIAKKIKIDEKIEIYRNYYFEIPKSISEVWKNKYDFNIPMHYILRVALDYVIGDVWSHHIDRPAYRALSYKSLLKINKRFTDYYKDPKIFYNDISLSNAYRKGRSLGNIPYDKGGIIDSSFIDEFIKKVINHK